jgi:hypothetical protein
MARVGDGDGAVNRGRRDRLGEVIYPEPRPFDTFEQFQRAQHEDIAGMTDEKLDDERWAARTRRALSTEPTEWLRERIARLEAEASRRRQQQGRKAIR